VVSLSNHERNQFVQHFPKEFTTCGMNRLGEITSEIVEHVG
jgi:hypothetical protein